MNSNFGIAIKKVKNITKILILLMLKNFRDQNHSTRPRYNEIFNL